MSPIRFDGQVVVVTGAGRGLGAAYARLLAARGAAVVVHDAGVAQDGSGFDPSVADGVVSEIAATGGTAAACYENLQDAAACARVVEFAVARFGRLDALVHNAGLVVFASLEETAPAVWDRMVANRRRCTVPSRARGGSAHAAAGLRAHRPHHIGPGHAGRGLRTRPDRLLGSQDGASRPHGGLAAELHDTGIRVNAISPVAATRVLRRPALELLPDLVAPGVAFLASSACGISGVVLNAAGGRFSAAWWNRSEALDLGPTPASPEEIAVRWQQITGSAPPAPVPR